MNVKRITRLLKLLELLQSGSGQNADGLAEACGVSRRTAFRDIEALRAAGVPVVFDEDRDHYSIPGTYFLPPINFTPAEALSLVALANEFGRSDRLTFYEPARTAARKLEDSLPPALRDELRQMTRAIHIQPTPVSPLAAKQEIYQQLIPGGGADDHVVVRFQPLVAQNVGEVLWHKTQQLEFQPDGTLLYKVRVSGLGEIMWWIIGYGDQAEVIAPPKLRQMVATRAKNLSAVYNGKV